MTSKNASRQWMNMTDEQLQRERDAFQRRVDAQVAKDARCGMPDCQRKASFYRVIIDDNMVRICSRHAAIEKHNREER